MALNGIVFDHIGNGLGLRDATFGACAMTRATTGSRAFAAPLDWLLQRRQPFAHSRRVAIDVVGLLDIVGIVLGGVVAAYVFQPFDVPMGVTLRTLQGCLLTALFAYLCLRHFGLYDTQTVDALPIKPLHILAALGIAYMTALGVGLPFGFTSSTFWRWYGVWALVSVSAIVATRIAARRVLTALARSGSFDTRIAIYGTGPLADRIITLVTEPSLHCRFVGAFDDRADLARHGSPAPGVIGGIEDLIRDGRNGAFDQVIIALPQSADQRTSDIARRLEQLPVSLHIVTHVAGDLVEQSSVHRVSSLGAVGLIDIKTKPLADWGRHLKSVEDFVIASVALVLTLPVMAVIALVIKWDSPGPVLFRQKRHGLNRRSIEVLKFRSMSVTENGADVRQATRGDARITRVGAFLRKSSLDELPQLVNVLKGEMSLIGPRPHALVHDDMYGEMLERYANRHQVKPGMTGWAQVNGFRGPTETPEKMQARVEHDLSYIDNWSLWLDLRILWLTVLHGFRNKNAC
ncbi:MAG: undecaprenyl-phosphate glucose phosphotransferase [Hyphomicrobiaceae bacterium]